MTAEAAPHTLVLENGPLRFTARSLGTGPLVLLLHGFPDTECSFDHQLPALAAAGYRAIAVRMRGYEPRSQPEDADYHSAAMASDVIAWMDGLGVSRAHLVGHDWGAIVAQAAVASAPERFRSLTIIAVPRLAPLARLIRKDRDQRRRSLYGLFFRWRGFSDFYLGWRNFAYLERLWRRWSPGWPIPFETLARVKSVFREPGVVRAALSYYRQASDRQSAAGKASARLLGTPLSVAVLGICGARDGCIAADIFRQAMPAADFPAGYRISEIAAAGHFLHQEQPEDVNRLLIEWIGASGD
jgi:pimeloyl-ACP methyl ester carboxylesterase